MSTAVTITDDRSPADTRPAFLPVDWQAWWLWIAVCAASPVCLALAGMALSKTFNPADPYIALIRAATWAVIWIGSLTPPLLYWIALRRIAPQLSLPLWIGGLVLVGIGWLVFVSYTPRSGSEWIDFVTRAKTHFNLAGTRAKIGGGLMSGAFFDLPWARLLLSAAITTTLITFIPAWMVASATRRRLHTFLLAAIFGGCMAAIVEQLFTLFGYSRLTFFHSLNGRPWIERGNELLLMAATGAVFGAASAWAFVMMSGSGRASGATEPGRQPLGAKALVVMGLAVVAIPMLAAFGAYLGGPQGVRTGAPALRKTFTLTPTERSDGDGVLTFAQAADITAHPQSTKFDFAPDGKSGVVLTAQRELKLIDLATGRVIRQIGEPLDALERFTAQWSPDGRFFVVRSNGAKFAIPNTHYSSYATRIRLFALPDYRPAGEFESEPECAYYTQKMLFEPDSSSLWIACSKMYAPKPDDPLAIKLSIPGLQAEQRYLYGESAAGGAVKDLARIGDSIRAWQNGSGDYRFRLHDLSQGKLLLTLPDLRTPDLAGKLTFQDFRTRIDEAQIALVSCGLRTEVANVAPGTPAAPGGFVCRTLRFDAQTGALLGSSDNVDSRFTPNTMARDIGHGLRLEARWQNDSKTGELIVHDAATGRQRQRIVSVSQRPLGVSPDGRWLVTYAPDQRAMRFYRVNP